MGLTLSPLLSDSAVLQREKPLRIWGTAAPGAQVTVTFVERTNRTQAGADGSWSVLLDACPPGGPHNMEIICGQERIVRKDILIGDVWLCAGQSNMEYTMEQVRHMYPEEMARQDYPPIRLFKVPKEQRFGGPAAELSSGRWQHAKGDTIGEFTAVGYFFAKRLQERYGIPIGLVAAAVGGTPIHTWMSGEMLAGFPLELAQAGMCKDEAYVQSVRSAEATRSAAWNEALDQGDRGLLERWFSPDLDDRHWPQRTLCADWEGELSTPGSLWFRKEIQIPPELAGKPATVFLGTIADADTLYVNGVAIGATATRHPTREYQIPSLPAGRCVLAMRVVNRYGSGGFAAGKLRMLVCGGRCVDLNGHWKYHRGVACPLFEAETDFGRKPTAYYNGMIAPLHPFPICGMIWYQGETDAPYPQGYHQKFAAMVAGWRRQWGDDFPVLFTQLAHYLPDNGIDWEPLRQEQIRCLEVPNTAMVSTMDVGEFSDLHPKNKQAVGDRLAHAAMELAYGEALSPSPFVMWPPI